VQTDTDACRTESGLQARPPQFFCFDGDILGTTCFVLREKFHQHQLTPGTSEKAFEEKLRIQRVGKNRSLEFALHPWIDSGLIKLGVWLWASSLIWRE
jgi:hypothetical protein